MWILPSTDINLFLSAGLPQHEDLRVFGTSDYAIQPPRGQWLEHTRDANCTFSFHVEGLRPAVHVPGSVTQIVSPTAGVLRVTSGDAPGTTMIRMDVQVGSFPHARHLLRVSTHNDVIELMAGSNSRSLFAGRSDRVLTVYARVPPVAADPMLPQVVDITGHSCLSYNGFDPSIATVDPTGRIHGIGPGTTEVFITLVDGRSPGGLLRVEIHVANALDGSPAYRSEDLGARSPRANRRLFFVAEGYQNGDRFFDMAREVAHHIMHDGVNKPFCYLRDTFHCIGIFLPSREQGITVASRIRNGTDDDMIPTWRTWTSTTAEPLPPWKEAAPEPRWLLRERDTVHGLCWGARPSHHQAPRFRNSDTIEQDFYELDDVPVHLLTNSDGAGRPRSAAAVSQQVNGYYETVINLERLFQPLTISQLTIKRL